MSLPDENQIDTNLNSRPYSSTNPFAPNIHNTSAPTVSSAFNIKKSEYSCNYRYFAKLLARQFDQRVKIVNILFDNITILPQNFSAIRAFRNSIAHAIKYI